MGFLLRFSRVLIPFNRSLDYPASESNTKTESIIMKLNTNENVSLVINAPINSREMMDFVSKAAKSAVKGNGQLPEEIADIFTLEVFTRPSGSKYGVLNFA